MDEKQIAELQSLFDSIVCLVAEGPEIHTKGWLMRAIKKEAVKGYNLCKRSLTNHSSRAAEACPFCDCLAIDEMGHCQGCGKLTKPPPA